MDIDGSIDGCVPFHVPKQRLSDRLPRESKYAEKEFQSPQCGAFLVFDFGQLLKGLFCVPNTSNRPMPVVFLCCTASSLCLHNSYDAKMVMVYYVCVWYGTWDVKM